LFVAFLVLLPIAAGSFLRSFSCGLFEAACLYGLFEAACLYGLFEAAFFMQWSKIRPF